jgi:hypothetical protein
MATLGPQIVSQSYGNLLKFLPTGEAGVTTNQVQITDGKGKVTPLHLATGSVLVDSEFTASVEVVFSGLTQATQTNIVCIDGSGRLYFQNSASFQDNDWTVGSSYMTASGQTSVYIPNKLENGNKNSSVGNYSHAEGSHSLSLGQFSHAEGRATTSSGYGSHAEGVETNSPGAAAHAEGKGTIAGVGLGDGDLAHAEGHYTKALSFASHAEGNNTYASASYAHAEGNATSASGVGAHAEGNKTLASGQGAHAEGSETLASLPYSHAEGRWTTASQWGAHAEGRGSIASAAYSHAEGLETLASNLASHAEGKGGVASGEISHAEGHYTVASGWHSHAEGDHTLASGSGAHSGGTFTTASLDYQTVVGQYNVGNYPNGNDTFVVGTGFDTNTNRRDTLKVRQTLVTQTGGVTAQGQVILPRKNNIIPPLQSGNQVITTATDQGLYFDEPSNNNTFKAVQLPVSLPNGTGPNSFNIMQSNNGIFAFLYISVFRTQLDAVPVFNF